MLLLTNAKIMSMSDGGYEKGFIYIKEGKIEIVDCMTNLPQNLASKPTLDLEGKTITPGFIDAHTHLGMMEDGVGNEGDDINELSDPITPHIRAIDAIDPLDLSLTEALSSGVTTAVVTPGSSNPIAGQIVAIKTFGNDVEKMSLSSPLAMKFSMGENPKNIYGTNDQAPTSRMATAALIREQLFKTRRYIEDKLHALEEESSPPEFDFKLESLVPVIERKVKAHFHAHRAYDIQTAIRIAKEFNLDYLIVHGTEAYRIAEQLKAENCSVVCGPIIGTRSKAELSRQTLDNVGILIKSGVNAAVSSDHPEVPSRFLSLSSSILVSHGISDLQALLSITYNAAKAVGLEHRVGSIQKGMDADLLVFDSASFDIRNKPEMVYIEGQRVV